MFRSIICNLHGRNFRGHGITRVLNGIMYTFCRHCWRNRFEDCESLMPGDERNQQKGGKSQCVISSVPSANRPLSRSEFSKVRVERLAGRNALEPSVTRFALTRLALNAACAVGEAERPRPPDVSRKLNLGRVLMKHSSL